jgi:hypothetical protein
MQDSMLPGREISDAALEYCREASAVLNCGTSELAALNLSGSRMSATNEAT